MVACILRWIKQGPWFGLRRRNGDTFEDLFKGLPNSPSSVSPVERIAGDPAPAMAAHATEARSARPATNAKALLGPSGPFAVETLRIMIADAIAGQPAGGCDLEAARIRLGAVSR
jgi:hypothetical protein